VVIQIAVVGGSIGGLTAGCLLADAGHDVTIYERSPSQLEERGAGIVLLPTTSRYLIEVAGVDVSTISVRTGHVRTLGRDGAVAHTTARANRFSSWNTVYREMLRCFDSSRYLLGHELVDIEPDVPRLSFGGGVTAEPDLAVCADGVGSAARTCLLPHVAAVYSGYVAWRGVVEEGSLSAATRAALDDSITYFVYANSHILVYPIPGRDGSVAVGERLINIVWYRNYSAGDDLERLLTDRSGARREVSVPPGALADDQVAEARAVATARLPRCIAEVVDAIDGLFVQVVVDLEVAAMVFGRSCLLGDAAFAVRPHAGAGTAKAAADAWALRDALAARPDAPEAALAAWESAQLALGRSLLDRTRAIGRRSQFDDTWVAGDPDLMFGLYAPGE
jgi:2,6-dihydroxypyridine 3-monooxygenase